MSRSGPPDDLSSKHHQMAYMVAAGRSNAEIQQVLGYHPHSIARIKTSPLLKELVAQIHREIREEIARSLSGFFLMEAKASARKVVELRETAKSERIQLDAAITMLDRTAASSKVTRSQDERRLEVEIRTEDIQRFEIIDAEDRDTVFPEGLQEIGLDELPADAGTGGGTP